MSSEWPPALPYESWSATCDTLHAHTQVLGKLAVVLARPEPQLQHAALRLSARGWETLPLPAPDGSGALVVALDLRTHEAVAEHSDGRVQRVALTPDRAVGEVTREGLAAVRGLVWPARIDPTPQETPWPPPPCHRRPRAGTRSSACTCSTGTTSVRARTRTRPRWSSVARRSGTPVGCATGTRCCRPAPRARRRPSSDRR